jgi:ABC-type lipoprotein export system ATPase subunit
VAIARAIVNRPPIILADEPTGNLDSSTAREIMGLLQDLNREGHTIIMVTHNLEMEAFAHREVSGCRTEKWLEKLRPDLVFRAGFSPPGGLGS